MVVRDVVGTVARFGLAAVWLVSGGLKAVDPEQTYLAVAAFDVLPSATVSPVAAVLPFLELALGILLVVGFGTRPVAVVSAVVLVAFIAGVTQAWARGLSIDCGCFGGGGAVAPSETRYPQELARDVGFLVLAAWLVARPRTLLAADRLLGRRADVLGDEPTEKTVDAPTDDAVDGPTGDPVDEPTGDPVDPRNDAAGVTRHGTVAVTSGDAAGRRRGDAAGVAGDVAQDGV